MYYSFFAGWNFSMGESLLLTGILLVILVIVVIAVGAVLKDVTVLAKKEQRKQYSSGRLLIWLLALIISLTMAFVGLPTPLVLVILFWILGGKDWSRKKQVEASQINTQTKATSSDEDSSSKVIVG